MVCPSAPSVRLRPILNVPQEPSDSLADMRRIHYVNSHILTGDRTCKALLRYCRALAVAGKSDVVQIPVVTEGGGTVYAHLLIGPASEIFSTPVPDSVPTSRSTSRSSSTSRRRRCVSSRLGRRGTRR